MTARNYDIILQFANNIVDAGANYPAISGKFESGNVVIGLTSGATGQIANIDLASNTFKVISSNPCMISFDISIEFCFNLSRVFASSILEFSKRKVSLYK